MSPQEISFTASLIEQVQDLAEAEDVEIQEVALKPTDGPYVTYHSIAVWSTDATFKPGTVQCVQCAEAIYMFTLYYGRGPLWYYSDVGECLGNLLKACVERKLGILVLQDLQTVRPWRQLLEICFRQMPMILILTRQPVHHAALSMLGALQEDAVETDVLLAKIKIP